MLRTSLLILLTALPVAHAAQAPAFDRKTDVVYGRKHGMALTMDVFTPKENANGAAIVWIVSGGWFSAHEAINPGWIAEFLKRGYTVFAVVHGSQPRYHDPGNHPGPAPSGAIHPASRQGLSDRSRSNRHDGRLGGRPSLAHARDRRRQG